MQFIIHNLMGVSLLLHALLGCCWHHENCDHCAVISTHATTAHITESCCHHHQHSQDQDSDEGIFSTDPRDSCPCQDDSSCPHNPTKNHCPGVCQYLRTPKATVESPTLAQSLELTKLHPHECRLQQQNPAILVAVASHGFQPPLRLYLLVQHLLI